MTLDNLAHQAHKEKEAHLDPKVLEDLLGSRVCQVSTAKTEYLGHRASADLQ